MKVENVGLTDCGHLKRCEWKKPYLIWIFTSLLEKPFYARDFSAFVPSESLVEVTQIAERLLNTMNLQNGSFVFRSGSIAVAAIDVVGSRLERK